MNHKTPSKPVYATLTPLKDSKKPQDPLVDAVKLAPADCRCSYGLCSRALKKGIEVWYYQSNYYCEAKCLLADVKRG